MNVSIKIPFLLLSYSVHRKRKLLRWTPIRGSGLFTLTLTRKCINNIFMFYFMKDATYKRQIRKERRGEDDRQQSVDCVTRYARGADEPYILEAAPPRVRATADTLSTAPRWLSGRHPREIKRKCRGGSPAMIPQRTASSRPPNASLFYVKP